MESELKSLLEKTNISLLLDSYDALFSDFDPRPYHERSISDDFLLQVKRSVSEVKPGAFEMRFLIPKHIKNSHEEEMIKPRLHHYFHLQWQKLIHETKMTVWYGFFRTLLGFILMFISSLISHYFDGNLGLEFMRVVMEPAGWFLVWFGLDQIFYVARSQKPELEFLHKMSKAEIHFNTY